MLERAAACLKSGAARESLRCVAPRSKRMLHSTFWSHGAGDLDLPPWALSLLPMPVDLPLRGDDKSRRRDGKGNGGAQERQVQVGGSGMADGVFLDFLYPQQALASLHKRSTQQCQRWEKRNMRRLPDGFVVASRGYASRSKTAKAKRAARQQMVEDEEEDDFEDERQARDEEHNLEGPYERQPVCYRYGPGSTEPQYEETESMDFADSPMDLAEPSPEAARKLRNLMQFNRKKTDNALRARDLIDQSWQLFQALDEAAQDDGRLKTEYLSWLNVQENEKSDVYCAELYHAMPLEQRTLRVYEIALSLFMRRNQHLSAAKLHREALQNLENGHQITRTLFRYTIDNELWRLAIKTESRHREFYGDSSQMKLFWLHVSEIPQLLTRAMKLTGFLKDAERRDKISPADLRFCTTFFREAVAQEFLQEDATLHSVPSISKQNPPRRRIRELFRTLAKLGNDARTLFEETLIALIKPNTRVPYPKMHHLVSDIYRRYKFMASTKSVPPPSEGLLLPLLERVTEYKDRLHRDVKNRRNISIASLVADWESFHQRLSKAAHVRLTTYYARAGNVESFEKAMAAFKSQHPEPSAWRQVLWTSIYLHARKADLDGAQRAFAEVKRELAEHGEEPDLKCWNTLLHAHARADDPEGALTNLQNLVDYAKLKPDAHSFHPLTEVFAKRGDTDGVEDLLEQYDDLAQAPRTTPLLGSLITAFVRSDDVETAEKVLEHTVEKNKRGEVLGSLTKCFNIVLTAHATRRDMDATRRVYQWMRNEKVNLDTDSFAALILSLTVRRQTNAAYKIVTSAMKETAVQPTAFHYSLIMAGYNAVGRSEEALQVHRDMVRLNIRPTLSTRTAYLQARAMEEHRGTRRPLRGPYDELGPLDTTLEELSRLLPQTDNSGVSAKTPQINLKAGGVNDAELASHFDFLVFVHGKRRCFEVVQQLYKQYEEAAAERGVDQDAPPIRLLTALMSAYWRAGDHDEVDNIWKLAKERADAIAPTVPVPLLGGQRGEAEVEQQTQPGQQVPDALELEPPPKSSSTDLSTTEDQDTPSTSNQTLLASTESRTLPLPSPGRRHILTRPLRYYLASLHARNRIQDSIKTVSSLLAQGYVLDNRTFNYFLENLCRASPPLALLAFVLTEKFLMPNFPGWRGGRKTFPPRPRERAEGLQYLKARYLRPGVLMPQYRLLVRLGSVLLDVRRLEAMGRSGAKGAGGELERYVGTLAQIRRRAPRTLFAVQSMPRREDRLQSRLLRREY